MSPLTAQLRALADELLPDNSTQQISADDARRVFYAFADAVGALEARLNPATPISGNAQTHQPPSPGQIDFLFQTNR